MSEEQRRLVAYELHQAADMPLSTAPVDRAWMDAAPQRSYRCLPLAIANEAGWWIPCPATFVASWDGGLAKENVQITFNPPAETMDLSGLFAPIVVSADLPSPRSKAMRGSAVISATASSPFPSLTCSALLRGINLWVKGPTNYFKDGVQPLEGIVETDWLPATFTMNWKLTRPYHTVRFERGEPICMVVPIPRGLAEQLEPATFRSTTIRSLPREYREWEQSRSTFNADRCGLIRTR